MVVCVFYNLFRNQILEELKLDTQLLQDSGLLDTEPIQYNEQLNNLRLTLIDETGRVTFDNYADITKMENHNKRPEVKAAREKGEGMTVRKSTTMGKNTFYYAVIQPNGTILRVAKDGDSIWTIFINAIPIISGIGILILGLCIIVAHFLTKSLVAPIEQMANNIEECKHISTYKELMPFISTIQEQHANIVKGAKMRQEFTANVSHELKTPLTSISGYAELIESGMANETDTIRFAREIKRNSKRLLNLINDIIKLSELDGSDIKVEFKKVNLLEVARESVEMLQLAASNHHITLKVEGEDSFIRGNKSMLEEVVYNLCDNAIRYNNKGGEVTITIKKEERQVILSVKDTGIGISKENQERIFERFYRVDKSRSRLIGGTGLGLAIVKHIVAQHKGEIEVKSELDKGTEIRVYFRTY